MEAAARRGNDRHAAELRARPLPAHLRPVWECYLAFQRWRGAGGMGITPMTAPDLMAFSTLYGIAPTPWQADFLKAVDLAHVAIMQAED